MAQAPRIDFYLLATDGANARMTFCCRLTEKAYRKGYRIFILAEGEEQVRDVDQRLWTFRAGSFVPHATAGQAEDEPVVVGAQPPATVVDLLINLTGACPARWQQLSRIAEIVSQSADSLGSARERFRCYREGGAEPAYHRLDSA